MLLRQKLQERSNRRILYNGESRVLRIKLRSYLNKLNSAGVSIESAIKLSDGKLAGLMWHSEAAATEKEQPLKI